MKTIETIISARIADLEIENVTIKHTDHRGPLSELTIMELDLRKAGDKGDKEIQDEGDWLLSLL